MRAAARDMLDDALSFSVRAYAPGTRETYLCAARNTLRGVGDAVQLDVAIDARLLGGRRRANRWRATPSPRSECWKTYSSWAAPRMWLPLCPVSRSWVWSRSVCGSPSTARCRWLANRSRVSVSSTGGRHRLHTNRHRLPTNRHWSPTGGQWVTNGGQWVTNGGWCVTDGGWCVTNGGQWVTNGGWWVADGGWSVTDGGHLWTTPTHETGLQAIDNALQTATRRLSGTRPKSGTLGSMLRDMTMLALNRAHDRGTWIQTANHLVAVLTGVSNLDARDVDISQPSDTNPKPQQAPQGTLPQHVAQRGIGTAGAIPVQHDIWQRHRPPGLDRALRLAPDLGGSDDPILAPLAAAMERDGLLRRCPDTAGANLRAFRKPKSAAKGALLADLRLLNSLMGSPPVPFELPSLEQLAGLMEICKARGVATCYTKLDISNMFWSVRLPHEYADSFRFRVRGTTYAIPSLPFGWTHSPAIAVAVLAQYLAVTFPGEVIIIQYVDDILLVAANRTAPAHLPRP